VAYAWAVTLGAEAGVAMLRRTGLLEAAVEYAADSGAFPHAFALATAGGLRGALPDLHLRHAMALEDEGRFQEAEAEFIAAGGPPGWLQAGEGAAPRWGGVAVGLLCLPPGARAG
jgi:intraflagellar transport protein 172